jgi:hypothetical protein
MIQVREEFEPNLDLKPMKGAHLWVNERIACFIAAAIDEFQEAGGYHELDHNIDEHAGEILDELLQVEGWHEVKDKFGRKVFKSMPYAITGQQEQKGELRVGIVLTSKGLKIDIREWGKY